MTPQVKSVGLVTMMKVVQNEMKVPMIKTQLHIHTYDKVLFGTFLKGQSRRLPRPSIWCGPFNFEKGVTE